MIKVRLQGNIDEINSVKQHIEEHFDVLLESKAYQDRYSEYYRLYMECESKNERTNECSQKM